MAENVIPSGSLFLADVAKQTGVLAIACRRCDRAGRYRLDTLIERYGGNYGVPMLLRTLSEDCPKRQSLSAYDMCGIHCPDLPLLFQAPQRGP